MITSLSITFAFGAMVFWGLGDFLVQKMSRKLGNVEALIFINLVGALILFPFVAKSLWFLDINTFTPLFILSILDFAFGLTLLKAYEQGKLSVVEVVLVMELPLTIAWGLIFFHEKLNLLQLILILIIIAGVFFIAKEKLSLWQKILKAFGRRHLAIESGAIIALIAALLSSFYNFFIAFNAREVSPFMTIWLPWTLSLIWLLIYYLIKNGFGQSLKILSHHGRQYRKLIIYGSVIDVVAWLFYASAVGQGELSITTAITESYPALAIFLGIKYNKEKISRWQFFGALLALGGSIMIALIS